MTTQETFNKAIADIIEKIKNLPDEIESMENFEFVTLNISAGKAEIINRLQNIPQFTPAFSEARNMEQALYNASREAKEAFYSVIKP